LFPERAEEMTEVIPGIYQLQIPIPNNPLGCTNVYLVQGDNEYLLIDAGWPGENSLQSFKEQLSEIGIDIRDIARILVTHGHYDHYGLAGKLRQISQAEVILHHLDRDLINSRETNMGEFLRQTEQWMHINGLPDDELPAVGMAMAGMRRPEPTLPDTTLQGGEIISVGIFNFQVFWTPGHSPGHVCLYDYDQKILFSGAHILPVITPNVSLPPQSDMNPLGDFLNSLNSVKDLDVNLVLPAHEKLFTDLPGRVEEIARHHEYRNAEIMDALETEPKTAYQISQRITWMPELGGAQFKDLAPGDQRMAVSETLAHLEAMRVDGRVIKLPGDGIIHYQRP